MFNYVGEEVDMHKSLTNYLISIPIEGKDSRDEIIEIYNNWPEKDIYCTTLNRVSWALYYIREKCRTSYKVFKEAVMLEKECEEKGSMKKYIFTVGKDGKTVIPKAVPIKT